MDSEEWMKSHIERFFRWRPRPSQATLNECARLLTDATSVSPVRIQGPSSYTVVTSSSGVKTVVSFRIPEAKLHGDETQALAREVHGDLCPEAVYHNDIGGETIGNRPLGVYTMPLLPGKNLVRVMTTSARARPQLLDPEALRRQSNLVAHLARYFARAWRSAPFVDGAQASSERWSMLKKVAILDSQPQYAFLRPHLRELRGRDGIALLFSPNHPHVLTHGNIDPTNLLVDPETFDIRGIVGWSSARIAPFGLELTALRRVCGTMVDGERWVDFQQRDVLEQRFWDEFFDRTDIRDDAEQKRVRRVAEIAATLGTILEYAFRRTMGGQSLDEVARSSYVTGWLGHPSWGHIVQGDDEVLADEPQKGV
ncbi:hypothetical protein F4778DRAFT_721139 [Xylariomycetidae sp. FL2044]|nr:hypothetical protein F4778DRAFT_721139 [Xylariomycetidae sp. FL2044]